MIKNQSISQSINQSNLGGGAGLHSAELLVALGVPQLVQSHIKDHQELQAPPDQSDGDIVDSHHLRSLVLDHIVQQLVEGLRHTETTQ